MKRLLVLVVLVSVSASGQEATDAAWARLTELHAKAVEAQNAGRYIEAERYHRETLDSADAIPEFPPDARSQLLSNLASVLNLRGNPDEALDLLLEAEKLLQKNPSNDPGQYITLELNFGRAYALREQWQEAESHYSAARVQIEAASLLETAYGAENHLGFAYLYWKTGRLEEAEQSYNLALAYFRWRLGPTHLAVQRMQEELVAVQSEMKIKN